MKARFTLVLVFAGALISGGFAQGTTKVRFYIKGASEFSIRLDGETLPQTNVHFIEPGTHRIEIWSPMHQSYSGEMVVPAKDSISYYRELKKDPDYLAYLSEMDQYQRHVFFGNTAPIMAAVAGTVATPFLHVIRKRWHEEYVIADFKSEYFASESEGLDNIRIKYHSYNVLYFTGIGLAVGGAATYFLLRKKINAIEKPVYHQQNPFTLETFELGWNPHIQSPQMGLTLNF